MTPDPLLREHLELLIHLGWIIFGCISVLAAAFTIVGSIAFWKATRGQAKTFSLLFERAEAVRISAVVLIIFAVVLLGIIGKIDSSGIIAILSGVAGYVLGGLDKGPKTSAGGAQMESKENDG